jgi:hypothetical protein
MAHEEFVVVNCWAWSFPATVQILADMADGKNISDRTMKKRINFLNDFIR